jgi:hypothetical protein
VLAKLKHFAAQKTINQILTTIKIFSNPLFTNKITETVKILMKKIVDPKLKYPIDNIYDEKKLGSNSKKVAAARRKKWQRLEKISVVHCKLMTKMTKSQISKNVAIVVGQKKKLMQFVNVKKLGIKCLMTLIVT